MNEVEIVLIQIVTCRVLRARSGRGQGMAALDVVVAFYSDRSFEPWLAELSRALEGAAVVRSVVYDKSGSVALPAADEHVRLRNIGRESETYLQHIVRNYENGLAAYTLFVQDDISSVHVPERHRESFYARIHRVVREGACGEVLRVAYRGRKLAPRRRIAAGDPLHGRLHAACVRFGIDMPAEYETNVCAILLVSREHIRRRPRAFYERLLAWHGESASAPDRKRRNYEEQVPWVLEHLWQLIFFETPQPLLRRFWPSYYRGPFWTEQRAQLLDRTCHTFARHLCELCTLLIGSVCLSRVLWSTRKGTALASHSS